MGKHPRSSRLFTVVIGLIAWMSTVGLTPLTGPVPPPPPDPWVSPADFELGWLSPKEMLRLVSGYDMLVTQTDGAKFGEVHGQGQSGNGASVVWRPASSDKPATGRFETQGNQGCFSYPTLGRFCYRYFNNGEYLTGYYNGVENYRIFNVRPAVAIRTWGPGGNNGGNIQCYGDQAVYCGPSHCRNHGNAQACTKDRRCRCEPDGKPVWER